MKTQQQPVLATAAGWLSDWAWLPIPVMAAAITALWVADPRIEWYSSWAYGLIHYGSVLLGILFLVVPAARNFLVNGEPGVLMLGCGVLMVEIGVAFMPAATARSTGAGFAVYNVAALLSALCQFIGVAVSVRLKAHLRPLWTWLAAALASSTAVMSLVIWLVFSGFMPSFFIDGQGGTLLRALMVAVNIVLLLMAGNMLWQADRRTPSPFLHWYALGLFLSAVGLAGSLLIVKINSPLQWFTRSTQFFGLGYMVVAVWAMAEENGSEASWLAAFSSAWREIKSLAGFRQTTPLRRFWNYALAAGAVAAALGLRLALTAWGGPGLPMYITFYPAVLVAALLAGFGPGAAATGLTAVVVEYWFLPPVGQFTVGAPVDRLGLVIFVVMGLGMSLVAELYRRTRDKAAAFDRHEAMRESERKLDAVFQSVTETIMLVDMDCKILAANSTAASRWNLPVHELIGRNCFGLITPEVQIKRTEQIQEMIATRRPVRFEDQRDNAVYDLNFYPISNAAGKIYQFVVFVRDITERKRGEEALRESEERFRLALRNAPVSVAVQNRDLTFLWAYNQRTVNPEDIFGKTDKDLFAPEDAAHLVALKRRVMETGQEYTEQLWITSNGKRVFLSLHLEPVRDPAGEIIGVGIATVDLTRRKQIEEEFETTIRFLRLIIEARDTKSLIRMVADFLKEISGFEAVGVRLKQGDDFPYVETRGFPPAFVEAERSLCARDGEGRLVCDGQGYPIMECLCGNVIQKRFDPAQPFFTERGNFWTNRTTEFLATSTEAQRQVRTRNRCHGEGYESVGLFGLRVGEERLGLLQFNDKRPDMFTPDSLLLWERLAEYLGVAVAKFRAEEALRESEKKFSVMFRSNPIGISLATTPDGALFDVNQAWLDMVGCVHKGEVIGKTSADLGLAPEPEQCEAILREFREHGFLRNMEMVMRTKSGSLRTVLVNVDTVYLRGRSFMLSTNEDITERKQAEEILRRDKATVERLVQERTEQLVEAQIELERAKRLSDIGVLAATVAHELRNPLAAIGLAVFSINKKARDPGLEKYAALINKKIAESDQIISNLLFYSRLKPPQIEAFKICDVLQECVDAAAAQLPAAATLVSTLDASRDVVLEADPVQIKEVVNNLLNNARDAVPPERGRIEVSAAVADGTLNIVVADNGAEIDPAVLAKVFDPFFTTKAKGTGLGLSVCQQIVNLHAGSIDIQSRNGKGTAVSVRLPLKGRNHVQA